MNRDLLVFRVVGGLVREMGNGRGKKKNEVGQENARCLATFPPFVFRLTPPVSRLPSSPVSFRAAAVSNPAYAPWRPRPRLQAPYCSADKNEKAR